MKSDLSKYFRFTGPSRVDKSINSLVGLIEGIAVDASISRDELRFVNLWLSEHEELKNAHPYNELVPVLGRALADGVLTKDEKEDVLWLCERLRSSDYFDLATSDLQRLHALLGGIACDSIISEAELRGLSGWLESHDHLKTCWPYEEVSTLITSVLADKRISEQEHKLLMDFFSEFLSVLDNKTIVNPKTIEAGVIVGLCATCPEIAFAGSSFCFTGASAKYTRSQLSDLVITLGGSVVTSVSATLDYLVIGGDGNLCWAYTCYGRKVEKAVTLRKEGSKLLLVHEYDFHDAVADAGLH